MKVVIPMAGKGDRFVKVNYESPKPLIKINGNKMIIEYILDMFDLNNDDIFFICNETHINETDMYKILKGLVPDSKIITISDHKKGPVHTVIDSKVLDEIDDDEEVIVCYCDNPFLWNYDEFKEWVKINDVDGCILSHTGFHPHRLNTTFMAHILEDKGRLIEIKEKEPYTDNPMNEHASTGTYYFKKSSYIKKYFNEIVEKDINYNGEYYVTLVYNLLVNDNLKIYSYPTKYVTVFGTPEEVKNFEAWQILLEGHQINNEKDLIKSYSYWKEYNQNSRYGNKQRT